MALKSWLCRNFGIFCNYRPSGSNTGGSQMPGDLLDLWKQIEEMKDETSQSTLIEFADRAVKHPEFAEDILKLSDSLQATVATDNFVDQSRVYKLRAESFVALNRMDEAQLSLDMSNHLAQLTILNEQLKTRALNL